MTFRGMIEVPAQISVLNAPKFHTQFLKRVGLV